jgi:hypothetical protein
LGLKKEIDKNASKGVFVHAFNENYCQLKIMLSCVFFSTHNLLHFKTFVLQEGHYGDDQKIWSVPKINFVCFFDMGDS